MVFPKAFSMVTEDKYCNTKFTVKQSSKKCMKTQRKGERTFQPFSPTKGGGLRVYDDCQRVAYQVCPGDGHSLDNGKGNFAFPSSICTNDRGQKENIKDQKNQSSMSDSISQAFSGPEDNLTDPHETLTETSTLTFVDAHTIDESVEQLHLCITAPCKEFLLIDDDDDGDMSLREKTVTDMSIMDGSAADLVCGRLLSISSGSLSECKEESSAPEPSPLAEMESTHQRLPCCSCTIL